VRIDIHNILLLNRKQSVEENLGSTREKLGFQLWKKAMLNRRLMNIGGSRLKQWVLELLFKNSWSKRRKEPILAPQSFNEMWKKRKR
jgi:L-lactate dehydrogenase complex protein LldF